MRQSSRRQGPIKKVPDELEKRIAAKKKAKDCFLGLSFFEPIYFIAWNKASDKNKR